jgi:hypothetical protein
MNALRQIIGMMAGHAAGGGGGALPVLVGFGNAASSGGGVTIPLPADVQEDDILIAFMHTQHSSAISISGWTEAGSSPLDGAGGTRLTVYWKRAGSSESDPTTSDSGFSNWGRICNVRGCPTAGDPFDVTNNGGTGAAGTSFSVNGATTTVANCLVLVAMSMEAGSADSNAFSGWTNADLANITEIFDDLVGLPGYGGCGLATGEKASAGAYGATTGTKTSGLGYAGWTGALKGA